MARSFIVASLAVSLLVSCAQKQSPTSLVEDYLNALKAGDSTSAQSLFCVPGDFPNTPLYGANSWEILSEKPAQNEEIPYTEVMTRVVSPGIGEEVTREWEIQVWTPENHFRAAEKFNQKFAEFGGRPPVLNRDEWSKENLCIFIPDPES